MRKLAVNDAYWTEDEPIVRPGTLPKWSPPSVRHIQTWVQGLSEGGSPVLAVTGPHPLFRKEVFETFYQSTDLLVEGASSNTQDWLNLGLLPDLTQRVRAMTGRPWGILWDLLTTEDFIVEEPLKSLIDQGNTLTGFFKGLWEARFLIQEGRKTDSLTLVGALLRWQMGQALTTAHHTWLEKVHIDRELMSPQERLDMLFFMLALVYQNGLVDRSVFVFDGLERVIRAPAEKRKDLLRQVMDCLTILTRWSRLGSATGIVLGFDANGDTLNSLRHYNDRLGKLVASSLV